MKTLNIYQVGELLTLEFDQTIDNIKNVYVKNEFDEVSFEQTEVKNMETPTSTTIYNVVARTKLYHATHPTFSPITMRNSPG